MEIRFSEELIKDLGKFRMIFVWSENEAYFIDMGTHDEVYRK